MVEHLIVKSNVWFKTLHYNFCKKFFFLKNNKPHSLFEFYFLEFKKIPYKKKLPKLCSRTLFYGFQPSIKTIDFSLFFFVLSFLFLFLLISDKTKEKSFVPKRKIFFFPNRNFGFQIFFSEYFFSKTKPYFYFYFILHGETNLRKDQSWFSLICG